MIDWERVAELRHEMGPDGFREVIDIFLEEVSVTLDDLADLPDGPARAGKLHFLKGCALNLGFAELAALCREAEAGTASAAELAGAFARARAVFLDRMARDGILRDNVRQVRA